MFGGVGELGFKRSQAWCPAFRIRLSSGRLRWVTMPLLTNGRAGQELLSAACGPLQLAHLGGPWQLVCSVLLHCLHLCSKLHVLAS